MVGGYLIAIAFFGNNPNLSPEWKLFVITGFLGGLTTFSSFSAEVVGFMQRGELNWALGTALLHLVGSLVLTFLGILTYTRRSNKIGGLLAPNLFSQHLFSAYHLLWLNVCRLNNSTPFLRF